MSATAQLREYCDAPYKLSEYHMVPVICPTCQIVFAGRRIDHPATLHGVVFDILVVGPSVARRMA
jgi:hypothetical protein